LSFNAGAAQLLRFCSPTEVDDTATFESKQLTLLVLSNAKPLAPADQQKISQQRG